MSRRSKNRPSPVITFARPGDEAFYVVGEPRTYRPEDLGLPPDPPREGRPYGSAVVDGIDVERGIVTLGTGRRR